MRFRIKRRTGWIAIVGLVLGLIWFGVMSGPLIAQNVANYMEQGGSRWVIGGSLDVASGGDLDIESGAALKIAGTDKTTALSAAVANPVNGVAASYKLARGTITLDGSNPSSAAHGLTTVIACTVTDVRSTAPGVDPTAFTYAIATTNIDVYAWKPTATADTALIASTDSDDVIAWICIGT